MSTLGFDFETGERLLFHQWWFNWLKEAPDIQLIFRSVAVLWCIWTSRNRRVFDQKQLTLEEIKRETEEIYNQVHESAQKEQIGRASCRERVCQYV